MNKYPPYNYIQLNYLPMHDILIQKRTPGATSSLTTYMKYVINTKQKVLSSLGFLLIWFWSYTECLGFKLLKKI